jgi:uncharacterized lipoprotein YbaY
MKYLFSFAVTSLLLVITITACAQNDKSKRPSPPAVVSQKVGDATITIHYSQPSLKGRTIGKEVEPKDGQLWRAGANEATVFETDKDIMVEGKPLPKGKYAFFTLNKGNDWILIFNKTWDQWGAYDYKAADDQLRVQVTAGISANDMEKLTYTIDDKGKVSLNWGSLQVSFMVK